jgi:hypothetical protein
MLIMNPSSSLLGQILAGRYRIIQDLGRGCPLDVKSRDIFDLPPAQRR